jgi:Cys-rich protein (TIGR01571 family)
MLVALAQIMTRLGFDFLGHPNPNVPRNGPWSTWEMMRLIISFWVFLNTVIMFGLGIKLVADLGISGADLTSLIMVNLVMFFYAAYATYSTRGSFREKYHIPEHRFIDVEDCLCATCCMPCTICQMGRHTVSYNEHQGACCTNTGIRDGVEERETELSTRWI